MRVLILSGGGFKGAFQVPIINKLLQEEEFDLILGTSVGAINGAMAAQGELNTLNNFWDAIDDSFGYNGIDGFLALSICKGKGIFSLSPLEKKIKKHISLDKLKTGFGCGITVRETHEYFNIYNHEMKDDNELHQYILGSSAISGLMEPVFKNINGKKSTLSDGGHIHVLPTPPSIFTDITAVPCFPLEKEYKCSREVDGIFEAFAWSFEMSLYATHLLDLKILGDFAKLGHKVRVYAPQTDLGSTIGASKKKYTVQNA